MAVPKFFEFLPIVLKILLDKTEKPMKSIREEAIEALHVSEEDCKELLPSGQQRTVDNRINWAVTYLKNAKLITAVRRSVYMISAEGRRAYDEVGMALDLKYLERYESFRSFHGEPNDTSVGCEEAAASTKKRSINFSNKLDDYSDEETPQDMLNRAYNQIRKALAEELLSIIMERSPQFFERLVRDLLLKMGYGSSVDSGKVVGRSGDEGIDVIIREDKLGFSNIYIQAKRWDPETMTVGRPEIQKFVGALVGQGASKGLFITTTRFTKEAVNYVEKQSAAKIVLVDGQQLTELMIEYGVGVSVQNIYMIKRIDSDYFEDII